MSNLISSCSIATIALPPHCLGSLTSVIFERGPNNRANHKESDCAFQPLSPAPHSLHSCKTLEPIGDKKTMPRCQPTSSDIDALCNTFYHMFDIQITITIVTWNLHYATGSPKLISCFQVCECVCFGLHVSGVSNNFNHFQLPTGNKPLISLSCNHFQSQSPLDQSAPVAMPSPSSP